MTILFLTKPSTYHVCQHRSLTVCCPRVYSPGLALTSKLAACTVILLSGLDMSGCLLQGGFGSSPPTEKPASISSYTLGPHWFPAQKVPIVPSSHATTDCACYQSWAVHYAVVFFVNASCLFFNASCLFCLSCSTFRRLGQSKSLLLLWTLVLVLIVEGRGLGKAHVFVLS